MDADFSHDPREIPNMLKAHGSSGILYWAHAISIGVRVVNWPLSRLFLSKGASYYVRIIDGLPWHDPTEALSASDAGVLEAIGLDSVRSNGYAFQIENDVQSVDDGLPSS